MFKKNKSDPVSQSLGDFETSVTGVDTIPKKKKGKKIAIISGVSAAVLVGGGVAAFNLSPLVQNQVRLRVMKPANYYAWVYEENAETLAKNISDRYRTALKQNENGQKSGIALKYEASDSAKDEILELILGSSYRDIDDEDNQLLVDIVDNFSDIQIGADISAQKGNAQYSLYGKYNGESLLTLDMVMDSYDMDFFFRIPELTEQYLGISLGEFMEDEIGNSDFMDVYKEILSDPAEYLSPDDLEKEIIRYAGVWNDTVSKVKVSKSEEVSISDIKTKYTVATVKVDGKLVYNLVRNFIKEAKSDDVIKNLIVKELDLVDSDEYKEFFDEILDDIDEDIFDIGNIGSFKTYIDPKGVIRGFSFKADGAELKCIGGKDGDQIRGEFSVEANNEIMFITELKATDNKGKYTGSIDLSVPEEELNLSVEFDDFELVDKEKFYMNGDVTFIIPKIDPITLHLDTDGKSQNISYDIVISDKDYGRITFSYYSEDGYDIDIPSKNDSFMIEPDSDPDFTDYVSEKQISDFVYNTLIKIGFSKDLARELADEAAEDVLSELEDAYEELTYDYSDDWDWDDDWDWN